MSLTSSFSINPLYEVKVKDVIIEIIRLTIYHFIEYMSVFIVCILECDDLKIADLNIDYYYHGRQQN